MRYRTIAAAIGTLALATPAMAQGASQMMSAQEAEQVLVESCGYDWPRARTDLSGDTLVLTRLGPSAEGRSGVNFDNSYRLETVIDYTNIDYSEVSMRVDAPPGYHNSTISFGISASSPGERAERNRRIREKLGSIPTFGEVTVACATWDLCIVSSFNQRLQCEIIFDTPGNGTGFRKDFSHTEECTLERAGSEPFTYGTRQISFTCYNPIEAMDALYVLSEAAAK